MSFLLADIGRKSEPTIMRNCTTILLILAATSVLAPPASLTPEELGRLSPEQLMQDYETFGLQLDGTGYAPTDSEPLSSTGGRGRAMETLGPEIIRRGKAVVPALVAFLEREVPVNRQSGLSFTRDLLEMLSAIGDARAVPTVLRILDGWEGKAQRNERDAALSALERLTYASFRRIELFYKSDISFVGWKYSVTRPEAVDWKYTNYDPVAKLYREWLAHEGKDSKQWLTLAKKRAKVLLGSENTGEIRSAKEFRGPGSE
jgi:hypothetical protein